MCVFLSCLPASEHFRSDVGKTKEGSIPPLVYNIANHSEKQVSPPSFTLSSYQFIINTHVRHFNTLRDTLKLRDWKLELLYCSYTPAAYQKK